MHHKLLRALLAALLLSVINTPVRAAAQTTAFTYQGQLNAGGTLPTGTYQFTFTLYDAPSGGAQIVGTTSIQRSIQVINGLFTTDLDFGQIFNGAQSWLEIKVGTTVPNEEALAARQPINAVPVAQYALSSAPNDFADFFALMPGDNAATVAPGGDVQFPQNGPSSGTGAIARVSPSQVQLSAIGTYRILYEVSTSEAGQLTVDLNGTDLLETTVGRATGTSQIVGMSLIQTTVVNSVLSIRNPVGNFIALTITPSAGGAHPVSAHLVITRLR